MALILWCVMIFLFSNVPNLSSGLEQDFLLRKIAHMGEFSILAFLFWLVIKRKKFGQALIFLMVFFCALDYAILDEIHQLFVRGRSGNIFDVGIDVMGIVLMTTILLMIQNRKVIIQRRRT